MSAIYPPAAGAQRFWPEVVDTVDVAAPRPTPQDELRRRSGSVTYIPLGESAPAGRDLGDLLDRSAGLHVHRYGGLGAFALASVRGSTPGQVLVCLDGVPVASAGEGVVNLALLPVSSLDHAEIYRGPQSPSFGGPPAAGVLQLVTPQRLAVPLRLSVAGGSFGTALALGEWGGTRGRIGGFISGQYRRSDGRYAYQSDNGTRYEPSDDRRVKRGNNDFKDLSLLWKGSLCPSADGGSGGAANPGPAGAGEPGFPQGPGAFRLGYTGQRFRRENGVAGHKGIQTRSVRFRADRTRHQLSLHLRPAWILRPSLEAAAHDDRSQDRFDNPDGEVGLGRSSADNRTVERGGNLVLASPSLPLRQQVRASFERREERWTPRDLLRGEVGFSRVRRHRTVGLEDRLLAGPLSLEASYRWARAEDNFAGPVNPLNPAATGSGRTLRFQSPGFGARLDMGSGLVVRANRGRMARFPSLSELFGENGIQTGNPGLKPEEGIQWDAGFAWSPRWPLRLECTYFERLVENQITLLQNSQRTTRAENLDRAWTRGVESSAYGLCRLAGRLTLEMQASHTWTEAVDVGRSRTYQGKRLPNLPRNEEYISACLARGAWGLRWEVSSRSSSFWHRYNQPEQTTPAYTVHDLSCERSLSRRAWKVRVEARNVGDVQVEDIDGFPLPGRFYLTEVTWTR